MVYILLGSGFEEAEALAAADVLRRAELPVTLAGIGGEYVTSSHAVTVRADQPVEDVVLRDGDMVVLPGGLGGVNAIEGSTAAMALVRQAAGDASLWLAAICAAPTLLGRWGLLEGKDAVCYPGMEEGLVGAVPPKLGNVARDGRIITGRAAGDAYDFAAELIEVLLDRAAADRVLEAICY